LFFKTKQSMHWVRQKTTAALKNCTRLSLITLVGRAGECFLLLLFSFLFDYCERERGIKIISEVVWRWCEPLEGSVTHRREVWHYKTLSSTLNINNIKIVKCIAARSCWSLMMAGSQPWYVWGKRNNCP
jgi:hypothetical protein